MNFTTHRREEDWHLAQPPACWGARGEPAAGTRVGTACSGSVLREAWKLGRGAGGGGARGASGKRARQGRGLRRRQGPQRGPGPGCPGRRPRRRGRAPGGQGRPRGRAEEPAGRPRGPRGRGRCGPRAVSGRGHPWGTSREPRAGSWAGRTPGSLTSGLGRCRRNAEGKTFPSARQPREVQAHRPSSCRAVPRGGGGEGGGDHSSRGPSSRHLIAAAAPGTARPGART